MRRPGRVGGESVEAGPIQPRFHFAEWQTRPVLRIRLRRVDHRPLMVRHLVERTWYAVVLVLLQRETPHRGRLVATPLGDLDLQPLFARRPGDLAGDLHPAEGEIVVAAVVAGRLPDQLGDRALGLGDPRLRPAIQDFPHPAASGSEILQAVVQLLPEAPSLLGSRHDRCLFVQEWTGQLAAAGQLGDRPALGPLAGQMRPVGIPVVDLLGLVVCLFPAEFRVLGHQRALEQRGLEPDSVLAQRISVGHPVPQFGDVGDPFHVPAAHPQVADLPQVSDDLLARARRAIRIEQPGGAVGMLRQARAVGIADPRFLAAVSVPSLRVAAGVAVRIAQRVVGDLLDQGIVVVQPIAFVPLVFGVRPALQVRVFATLVAPAFGERARDLDAFHRPRRDLPRRADVRGHRHRSPGAGCLLLLQRFRMPLRGFEPRVGPGITQRRRDGVDPFAVAQVRNPLADLHQARGDVRVVAQELRRQSRRDRLELGVSGQPLGGGEHALADPRAVLHELERPRMASGLADDAVGDDVVVERVDPDVVLIDAGLIGAREILWGERRVLRGQYLGRLPVRDLIEQQPGLPDRLRQRVLHPVRRQRVLELGRVLSELRVAGALPVLFQACRRVRIALGDSRELYVERRLARLRHREHPVGLMPEHLLQRVVVAARIGIGADHDEPSGPGRAVRADVRRHESDALRKRQRP
ncbi:hypothetical protein GCM10023319_24240 [Nocardia iowensis]